MQQEKFSYITVLSNEKYIPGVIALKNALKKVNAQFPLHVLIPEEQSEILLPILVQNDIKIVKRPYLSKNNGVTFKDSYWNHTFFKIAVTSLIEFDKIVLLDSDMLIVNNIDELFTKPNLSATIAGKTTHPEWVELNSGLMVIEPNMNMYDRLVGEIDKTIKQRNDNGLACGDQDVFASAFPEWKNNPSLHLDIKYNTFFRELPVLFKRKIYRKKKDVNVIHFIGRKKPWEYTFKQRMLVLLWCLKNLELKSYWYFKQYLKLIKK